MNVETKHVKLLAPPEEQPTIISKNINMNKYGKAFLYAMVIHQKFC